ELEKLRALLATEDGREAARRIDPFDDVRHVAGRATFKTASETSDPLLRDALLRWIHELLQAPVGLDLPIQDPDPVQRLGDRLPRRERAEVAAKTYTEAWSRALREDPSRGALERAADLAAPVAAVRKERRARRFEAARRLDLAHPFALASKTNLVPLAH